MAISEVNELEVEELIKKINPKIVIITIDTINGSAIIDINSPFGMLNLVYR